MKNSHDVILSAPKAREESPRSFGGCGRLRMTGGSSGALRLRMTGVRMTVIALSAAVCVLSGCTYEMKDQHKLEAYEKSGFYEDGMASRQPVEGTTARGYLKDDEHFYKGTVEGKAVDSFPFPVTEQVLARGRERYDIYCSACHGHTGTGNGMVVQRGFKQPPSFHIERLREAPAGHYYQVITSGFGTMYDYAAQITPKDRWAITAYVRALQLSQNAKLEHVPADVRARLEKESK